MTEKKEIWKEKAKPRKLEEITAPALSALETESEPTYEYLVSLVKDGSLERHQTKGKIVRIADDILKKLLGDVISNEN